MDEYHGTGPLLGADQLLSEQAILACIEREDQHGAEPRPSTPAPGTNTNEQQGTPDHPAPQDTFLPAEQNEGMFQDQNLPDAQTENRAEREGTEQSTSVSSHGQGQQLVKDVPPVTEQHAHVSPERNEQVAPPLATDQPGEEDEDRGVKAPYQTDIAATARGWAFDALKPELNAMEKRLGPEARKKLSDIVGADEVTYGFDRTTTAAALNLPVAGLDEMRDRFKRAERTHTKHLSVASTASAAAPPPVPVPNKRFLDLTDQERADERTRCWPIAQALAQKPDILACAVAALRAAGVLGEEKIVHAVLLAGIARLTSKPVSVTVKGASASGKSYTVRSTLDLLPPDAVFIMTAGSERALIYMPGGSFRHRLIFLAEATAIQQDDNSILALTFRSLLSEGEIRYVVADKDGDRIVSREIHQAGPTGLICTTTAQSIHAENETRQISIETNDTERQTRIVAISTAGREDVQPLNTAPWHALIRWIECGPVAAVVPFAGWLSLRVGTSALRMRRDFSQLLSLTKASAILHQATRRRDAQNRIVAEPQDYRIAASLITPTVEDAAGNAVSPSLRGVWQAVRDRVDNDLAHRTNLTPITDQERLSARVPMSSADLAKAIGRDRSTANRHLRAAIEAGLLVGETRGNVVTRVGVASLSLPSASNVSSGPFPAAGAVEAAQSEWEAAAETGRKMLSGAPLPLDFDPDSPF